jgi:hypothetical protein
MITRHLNIFKVQKTGFITRIKDNASYRELEIIDIE